MPATLDRRHFLGLCALATTAACTEHLRAAGPVDAGKLDELGVGYLGFVSGQALLIGRDAAGLYCLSAFCTFDGCDMSDDGELTDQGLACDCCNSLFDRFGTVKRSPATRRLDHFAVTVDAGGHVQVDPSKVVAFDARTPAVASSSPDATNEADAAADAGSG